MHISERDLEVKSLISTLALRTSTTTKLLFDRNATPFLNFPRSGNLFLRNQEQMTSHRGTISNFTTGQKNLKEGLLFTERKLCSTHSKKLAARLPWTSGGCWSDQIFKQVLFFPILKKQNDSYQVVGEKLVPGCISQWRSSHPELTHY